MSLAASKMDKKEIKIFKGKFWAELPTNNELWVNVAPIWFKFLGWSAVIAGIQALHEKTGNEALFIMKWFSYWCVFKYIQAKLDNTHIIIPFVKDKINENIINIAISSVLTLTLFGVITTIVRALVSSSG